MDNVNDIHCPICVLLKQPFSRLNTQEKLMWIKTDRPVPQVDIKQCCEVKGKTTYRHFKPENYIKFTWLTSCKIYNKLFCWPCLFFATVEKDKSVWNTSGYDDLNHFHTAAAKHEKTRVHINSLVCMKSFGQTRIDLQLDQQKHSSIILHNESVNRNRNIMKRLIDAVCFLGSQEIAFRSHDESNESNNRGNYVELLNFLAKYDESMAHHFSTATVFSGVSNRIQNAIIESVYNVIMANIKLEITKCNFVAIMLDETSDISHKSHLL